MPRGEVGRDENKKGHKQQQQKLKPEAYTFLCHPLCCNESLGLNKQINWHDSLTSN